MLHVHIDVNSSQKRSRCQLRYRHVGLMFTQKLYLVSHSVNFILVTAVTDIVVDSTGSITFSQSSSFLHPFLVDIPQHQHGAISCKFLSHETADSTTGSCNEHHLTSNVLLFLWHKEVDERLHIVPDGQKEYFDGFQEEIHNESGKKEERHQSKTKQTFPGIMNKTGNLDEMIFLQFFIQVASVRLQKPLCYSYDSF